VQMMQVDQLENLKNEEVIVYCRSGNRSGQAAMILDTLGFANTKNLSGGMLAWQSKFGQ
jgi:rhodanese-related sulfurtransferase